MTCLESSSAPAAVTDEVHTEAFGINKQQFLFCPPILKYPGLVLILQGQEFHQLTEVTQG